MQDIIVYIIITIAVAFALIRIYRKITGKHEPSDCTGDGSCDCLDCSDCKLFDTCSRNERLRFGNDKSGQEK